MRILAVSLLWLLGWTVSGPAVAEEPRAVGASHGDKGRSADAGSLREHLRTLEEELRLLGEISRRDPGSASQVDRRRDLVLSELRLLELRIYASGLEDTFELLAEVDALRLAAEAGPSEKPKGTPAPSTVTGTVTDAATGEPVLNVAVTFRGRPGSGLLIRSTRTQADGRYSVTVQPGIYFVTTRNDSGFVDELYDDLECAFVINRDCIPSTGTPVEVLPGATVSGIDFQLDRGGTLSGTVLDSATGEPVEGGAATALAVEHFKMRGGTTADPSGGYRVTGLPPGDYFVRLDHADYRSELYDDVECAGTVGEAGCDTSPATPFTIAADETVSGIDFVLDRKGVISGVVVSEAGGQPLDSIRVYVLGSDGLTVKSQLTDSSGRYSIGGLDSGTYFVGTQNFFRYLDEVHDDVPCPGGATLSDCDRDTWTPVTLPPSSAVTIDFALVPLTSISGTVRGSDNGAPLAGVEVQLWDGEGRMLTMAATDETGFYEARAYPGTYFLVTLNGHSGYLDEIYRDLPCERRLTDGCHATTGTPVELTLEASTSGVDFDLPRGGSITGRLTDAATGAPVTEGQVLVYNAAGILFASDFPDAAGNYVLTPLVTGEYFVEVRVGVYGGELFDDISCTSGCDLATGTPVAVVTGMTTGGIDFALRRLGAVTGKVTDQVTGKPIPGAHVLFVNATTLGQAGFVSTDQDGRYLAEGLDTGSYFAKVGPTSVYSGEIYDGVPCNDVAFGERCDPAGATPIEVEAGGTVTGIDFVLERLACPPLAGALCLADGRFLVDITWKNRFGETGIGRGTELTRDTGYFSFFSRTNVEVVVKVLDGCFPPFNTFWVFAAGLTNVETEITVTDTATDAVKQYRNTLGSAFQPVLDTAAFDSCDVVVTSLDAPAAASGPARQGSCVHGGSELCLDGERFRVEAFWETPDGKTGEGRAVALTRDTGYFWFFSPDNVEVVVKVLDACNLDPFFNYWSFAAGLTAVEVRLRVTDTVTGEFREYTNPQGNPFQPVLDTSAFATCP